MKTGLFFGTFNPPHAGHQHVIDLSFQFFQLDEIWMIPSPQNPFKVSHSILPFDTRFEMLRLVVKELNNPRVSVLDIEKNLPMPNYTYITMELLHKKYPSREFFIILGEDNINSFHKWKKYEDILAGASIIAYRRNDQPLTQDQFPYLYIKHPIKSISSTEIREKIITGESYEAEVPWETLRRYIQENKLYQS